MNLGKAQLGFHMRVSIPGGGILPPNALRQSTCSYATAAAAAAAAAVVLIIVLVLLLLAAAAVHCKQGFEPTPGLARCRLPLRPAAMLAAAAVQGQVRATG